MPPFSDWTVCQPPNLMSRLSASPQCPSHRNRRTAVKWAPLFRVKTRPPLRRLFSTTRAPSARGPSSHGWSPVYTMEEADNCRKSTPARSCWMSLLMTYRRRSASKNISVDQQPANSHQDVVGDSVDPESWRICSCAASGTSR